MKVYNRVCHHYQKLAQPVHHKGATFLSLRHTWRFQRALVGNSLCSLLSRCQRFNSFALGKALDRRIPLATCTISSAATSRHFFRRRQRRAHTANRTTPVNHSYVWSPTVRHDVMRDVTPLIPSAPHVYTTCNTIQSSPCFPSSRSSSLLNCCPLLLPLNVTEA